jgi:hypothetical protein
MGSLVFLEPHPRLSGLGRNSFPDQTGKPIRCTSYGQALYSLPGSKLNSKDASGWFKVFFQGLDNPLFFPYTGCGNLKTQ